MGYRIERRHEMKKVFDLFINFRRIIAINEIGALKEPLKIATDVVVLSEEGVDTDERGVITFGDYLDLLRDTEIRRVARGHQRVLKIGADIVDMIERKYGGFVVNMTFWNEKWDWLNISEKARDVLKRLKSSYPDILTTQ
jgi:hypothetical protein